MYSITLLLTLLGIARAADPFLDAQNPCATVRRATLVCSDCQTLAFCVQQDGAWKTIPMASCVTDNGFYCNEEMQSCRYQNDCDLVSRGVKFECQMPGQYPDPYDCKSYHVCDSTGTDTPKVCNLNLVYSPLFSACVADTLSTCNNAAYTCKDVGDRGAWPDNPQIFYVCFRKKNEQGEDILYPLLYSCGDEKIFNGFICVPGTSAAPNPAPSVASTVPPSVSAVCLANRLVADGNDCRAYYACSNGQVKHLQCPSGAYFDAGTMGCRLGSC